MAEGVRFLSCHRISSDDIATVVHSLGGSADSSGIDEWTIQTKESAIWLTFSNSEIEFLMEDFGEKVQEIVSSPIETLLSLSRTSDYDSVTIIKILVEELARRWKISVIIIEGRFYSTENFQLGFTLWEEELNSTQH